MVAKAEFRRLIDILRKRRTALRRNLANELSGLRQGAGIDIGDAADVAADDEFNLLSSQLAESESRELAKVEEALARIDEGRFGLCDGCNEKIPLPRLQALPYATRCVRCQRETERNQPQTLGARDWSVLRDVSDEEPHNPFLDHVVDIH